jgi:hypothetical protein
LEYPVTPIKALHLAQDEQVMQQQQPIRQIPPFKGSLSGFNIVSCPEVFGRFDDDTCCEGAAFKITDAPFVSNLHFTRPLQMHSAYKKPS